MLLSKQPQELLSTATLALVHKDNQGKSDQAASNNCNATIVQLRQSQCQANLFTTSHNYNATIVQLIQAQCQANLCPNIQLETLWEHLLLPFTAATRIGAQKNISYKNNHQLRHIRELAQF